MYVRSVWNLIHLGDIVLKKKQNFENLSSLILIKQFFFHTAADGASTLLFKTNKIALLYSFERDAAGYA